MTDHCTFCPFTACPECDYQGGVSAPAKRDLSCADGYSESAPNGAAPAGNRGLTRHSEQTGRGLAP